MFSDNEVKWIMRLIHVGIIASFLAAVGLVVGIGYGIYWAVNHLKVVP